MIRVLLAHRAVLLREALAALLSKQDGLVVVGAVAAADELLVAVHRTGPDVAVVDHALPGPVPIGELCRDLVAVLPTGGVLVMVDHHAAPGVGGELIRLAPRVGVVGIESSPAELVAGLHRLLRGEPVFDTAVAVAALTASENPLTGREREVLRLAVDGRPTVDIARTLFLSEGTVRNYISRAVAKTGARTRIEAIRVAQESGWI